MAATTEFDGRRAHLSRPNTFHCFNGDNVTVGRDGEQFYLKIS
jgi:hypothetical protein